MKSNMPKVSIIITCYNYAKYVERAIKSALGQNYKNIELIIINDGSTDDSEGIIEKYQDVAKIVSRNNKGVVYTRNEGVRLSGGDYICFLDADDYFDNNYIEKMLNVAKKYNADIVYPNWRIFGDENYTTNFKDFDLQLLIRQEIHCTSESLIRKKAIGVSKFQSKEIAEDWDFFIGLALKGKSFKLAKNCYINYRLHKNTRGSSRPYWEDMYHFCAILKSWSEKYPDKVNPFDLPIYVGRNKDNRISKLNEVINEKDKDIMRNHKTIKELKDQLYLIKNSRTWKIRNAISGKLGKEEIK